MQTQLIAALDQACNGTHLDKIPNHDDDSLFEIAYRIPSSADRKALLKHAERLQAALTSLEKKGDAE